MKKRIVASIVSLAVFGVCFVLPPATGVVITQGTALFLSYAFIKGE